MDRRKINSRVFKKVQGIKVLMLAAEVAPIAKVGGLGDVVGALPKALSNLGVDVRIVAPFYGLINKNKYKVKKLADNIPVVIGKKSERVSVWVTFLPGTKTSIYLIKHKYFDSKNIYAGGRITKKDKYTRGMDDIKRFSFFNKAALEVTKALKFKPDIIHAHDWHTALSPIFLNGNKDKFFAQTKTIYTIHNLANQGIAAPSILDFSGVNKNLSTIKADLKNGDINFMAEAILNSNIVNTVSPTYAKEILAKEEGADLDNLLKKRKKSLFGILNGIDTSFFNPRTDKLIKEEYNINELDKKVKNKLFLQKKLGFKVDEKVPLVGLVSRLVWQKGVDFIREDFLNLDCQFVILGSGEKKYEKYLEKLTLLAPEKFKIIIKFDEALAHQIYAAADIFLMPSRFEPCGLGQMIAMRYGTVPVVRATGGLKDTVIDYSFNFHPTGFIFKESNASALHKALSRTLDVYYNKPKVWRKLQLNGMKKDFSWEKSAKEYLKLYKKLV